MAQKKHEVIAEILSDYEKLANMVLHQLDEVKRLISPWSNFRGKSS